MLKAPVANDDGNEVSLGDTLMDPDFLFDSILCDKAEMDMLFARLEELMPEAREIGLLRQKGLIPEDWKPEHCLFGLHLLQGWGGTVAIVESEKTAVIMSALKPDCLWLATGGKTELNVAKLKPLCQHKVILFPDTDENGQAYREWYDIAETAGEVYGHPFTVSSLLELHATPAQKAAKIDLVDFLF